MRMARQTAILLGPNLKPGANIDPQDFMLYPDDALDVPDDLTPEERRNWIKMNRMGG